MKIILLEGIATSGKTTVKNFLVQELQKRNIRAHVVEEDETLMPILHNKDRDVAISHLNKVIQTYAHKDIDVLIFDRLYFTHVFRTDSTLDDFKEIEDFLKSHDSKIFFLKIHKDQIKRRILNAMKHRGQKWGAYVRTKGTDQEIVEFTQINKKKFLS